MPRLIPVGYPGPTAPSQLKVYDWLKDIPTTKVYNTNKYQSPPVALKQLKGEWAPIVCRKVQDPEQTVLVTGESGEKTGVSAVVSNQPLVVPQQQYSGPEKSVVRSTNNQPTFSTIAPETGFQPSKPSMTHSLTLTAQQSLNHSLPQKSMPQSVKIGTRSKFTRHLTPIPSNHTRGISSKYLLRIPANIHPYTRHILPEHFIPTLAKVHLY